MTDLTPEEKKALIDALGDSLGKEMKPFVEKASTNFDEREQERKTGIERMIRIEAKIDSLLMALKIHD